MSEYCKYCGQAYGDARTPLLNTFSYHPSAPARVLTDAKVNCNVCRMLQL